MRGLPAGHDPVCSKWQKPGHDAESRQAGGGWSARWDQVNSRFKQKWPRERGENLVNERRVRGGAASRRHRACSYSINGNRSKEAGSACGNMIQIKKSQFAMNF